MGKFVENRSEAFKVLCMCSRNTPTRLTKTAINRLTNNVHLATSARSICVFWIEGIPQLIVYLSHADTFILHSRQTSNDRSGGVMRDKTGVLQCALVSQLGHSLRVATSSSRGSSNQPISFLQLRSDMALRVAEALCATGGGGISCVCYRGAVRPQKSL